MTQKLIHNTNETVLIEELPPFLKKEMIAFMERNRISENNCCLWCLKAHLIEKAKEKDLDEWATEFIERILPERTGHMGYYLDGEKIKRITD